MVKERSIVLVIQGTIMDGLKFTPYVAAAMRAYADALEAGDAGKQSLEFFKAPNGCNVMGIAGSGEWMLPSGKSHYTYPEGVITNWSGPCGSTLS